MPMDVTFEKFIDYQLSENLKKPKVTNLHNRSELLRHCRLIVGNPNLTEFANMVEIDPLRIIQTYVCSDPATYKALSRDEFLAIADVCGCNISNWERWLPK